MAKIIIQVFSFNSLSLRLKFNINTEGIFVSKTFKTIVLSDHSCVTFPLIFLNILLTKTMYNLTLVISIFFFFYIYNYIYFCR